jgi:hypothetical protein
VGKDLTSEQKRVFHAPIGDPDVHRRQKSERTREAGQCSCDPWPCAGPSSAQWATCRAGACKGCRVLVDARDGHGDHVG